VDALTAVPNRRRFDELLESEWKRAVRAKSGLAVAMVDIDRFKAFNDSYGHQKGDDCLRQVAATLADGLPRSGDAIARYGGEEFAVILPHTDLEGARQVAEALRRRILSLELPNQASELGGIVTVSCGVAAAEPADGGDPQGLLTRADRALYQAKRGGRNRVETAS
jgi:diguanylate cyclase (GGDEF)-like protein